MAMRTLQRKDFSGGWTPSASETNAAKAAVLRADNLYLDELGIWSVRRGSSILYTLSETDVRVLFTSILAGVKRRFAAGSNTVYMDGASIFTPLAGSGDAAFGSYMQQVFFARSTTKRKYDGATLRNWGIAAPNAAPTVVALAPDSKTFASCNGAESPAFSADEGTITPTYPTGQDGTANGAIEVTPDGTTNRGSITKAFATDQNFTSYDGGDTGTDEDLIDLYVYITDPNEIESVTLMIDVNSSSQNLFQDDYYFHTFVSTETIEVLIEPQDFLDFDFTVEGFDRDLIRSRLEERIPLVTTFRKDKPVANAGWNHFTIARSKMQRVGATEGTNWSTVKAIRLTFQGKGSGAANVVRFDDVRIIGGQNRPLTGRFEWRYVFAKNFGDYVAFSPPSAASAELELKAQAASVTIPTGALSAMDSQVDEIWVYRFGGYTDAFYRVIKTVDVVDPVVLTDATSDRSALILNLRLETDNTPPPDDIIDIEGPYYTRLMCLTATHLYPSRRRNPDSFSAGQAIRVADGSTESAYWVKQALGGLYLGTSKDIYRIDGDGAELPDGTVNFRVRNMNVGNPPIKDNAVAQEGNVLVYLADDGWRMFNGSTSVPIRGDTDMLWKGYIRHGVEPINITSLTSRFRAAISNGIMSAITPEGGDTFTSDVLYRYNFSQGKWFRHPYPNPFWSIYRESDGTLIAGDNAGNIWELDVGNQDNLVDIPITLWTPRDDDARHLQRKEALDYQARVDTFTNAVTIDLHLDGSGSSAKTLSATVAGGGIFQEKIDDLALFRQIQQRITGSFSTFRWYESSIVYRDLPADLEAYLTPQMPLGKEEFVWLREIRIMVNAPTDLTVTPYFDDTAFSAETVVELWYRAAGSVTQKRSLRIPVGSRAA